MRTEAIPADGSSSGGRNIGEGPASDRASRNGGGAKSGPLRAGSEQRLKFLISRGGGGFEKAESGAGGGFEAEVRCFHVGMDDVTTGAVGEALAVVCRE